MDSRVTSHRKWELRMETTGRLCPESIKSQSQGPAVVLVWSKHEQGTSHFKNSNTGSATKGSRKLCHRTLFHGTRGGRLQEAEYRLNQILQLWGNLLVEMPAWFPHHKAAASFRVPVLLFQVTVCVSLGADQGLLNSTRSYPP